MRFQRLAGQRERHEIRVAIVNPAPDDRGDERDDGEKRIGEVKRREQRGGDNDASGSRRRRLGLAQQDDLETAKLLVQAGAAVNAANRYGVTPLSLACTNGSAAMIELLLNAKADPIMSAAQRAAVWKPF